MCRETPHPTSPSIAGIMRRLGTLEAHAFELAVGDLINNSSRDLGIEVLEVERRDDGEADLRGTWTELGRRPVIAVGQVKSLSRNPGSRDLHDLTRLVGWPKVRLIYFVCNRSTLAPGAQAYLKRLKRENPGIVFRTILRDELERLVCSWVQDKGDLDTEAFRRAAQRAPAVARRAPAFDPIRWVRRRAFFATLGVDRSAKNVDALIDGFSHSFGNVVRYDLLRVEEARRKVHPCGEGAPTIASICGRLRHEFPDAQVHHRWVSTLAVVSAHNKRLGGPRFEGPNRICLSGEVDATDTLYGVVLLRERLWLRVGPDLKVRAM